jgi:hypothetical protein
MAWILLWRRIWVLVKKKGTPTRLRDVMKMVYITLILKRFAVKNIITSQISRIIESRRLLADSFAQSFGIELL